MEVSAVSPLLAFVRRRIDAQPEEAVPSMSALYSYGHERSAGADPAHRPVEESHPARRRIHRLPLEGDQCEDRHESRSLPEQPKPAVETRPPTPWPWLMESG